MTARILTVALTLVFLLIAPSRILMEGQLAPQRDPHAYLLSVISYECKSNKVPVRLVHNIIDAESRWKNARDGEVVGDALLRSSEDAYGLMQVQLPTAREVLGTDTITAEDLMSDDILNMSAGIRYLAKLNKYYNGNWYLAVAAYNRGIKYVNKDISNHEYPLNPYVIRVTNGVDFGKCATERMRAEVLNISASADVMQN